MQTNRQENDTRNTFVYAVKASVYKEKWEWATDYYPIWWSDFPQIIYTFLDANDLSGKKVIPFSTHGGSGLAGTVETLKEQEPDADIEENALSISRDDMEGCESKVTDWLKEIGQL